MPTALYPPTRFLVLISVITEISTRNLLGGLVDPWDIVRLEGLGPTEKSNGLIWKRTYNLPACNIVHQPTMLPHVPVFELVFP
jgi:hypothetical protein